MTPSQVLILSALGGAAGLLTLLAIAALSYGIGLTAIKAFERLHEKRQQRAQRRELDTCNAIHALPDHTPRNPPMTACEPGRFCPDHTTEPGLLVVIAAAILALALFAAAAVALVAAIDAAARYTHRRYTRTRRALDRYAAAIARVRAGHDRDQDGTCATCHVTWPCPLLCRLAGPPCGPDCEEWHATPPQPAPPRPHRDVMAAAVEDWWTTTEPTHDTPTGPHLAAHVEMYLLSSGYHITPNP